MKIAKLLVFVFVLCSLLVLAACAGESHSPDTSAPEQTQPSATNPAQTKPTEAEQTQPTAEQIPSEGHTTPPSTEASVTEPSATECSHTYHDATCTTPKTCTKCGITVGSSKGHTEVVDQSKEATCTATGLSEGKHCSVCGIVLVAQEVVPVREHSYVDYTCKNCGYSLCSDGLEYTLNDDGKTYRVTGIGTCSDAELIIPAVYEGKPVTSIGEDAFVSCTGLTSVVIPSSVTRIGGGAFVSCTNLTDVAIPEGVAVIEGHTFDSCSSMTEITLPSSVTSIETGAFMACSGLVNIELPSGLLNIAHLAFEKCSDLTSIVIPSSVTAIGDLAFGNCGSLTGIQVEEGNAKYHSEDNCLIETESKTLLVGCQTSIIPSDGSVVSICDCAFYGCSGLERISIPSVVTSIGEAAFYNCTSLTGIEMHANITSIGNLALNGCVKLETITFKGTQEQWNAVTKISSWDFGAGVYTPKGKYEVIFEQ